MSGFRPFVRQLGFQPGVQLNPLQDQTDGVALDNSDQVGAVIARLTRGRIDKPFRVTRDNFIRLTGPAEAMRVNALNEAKLQVYEALANGAASFLIQRITPAAAAKRYAVLNFTGLPAETSETVAFSVADTLPTTGYSIALMHHNCHNDGIKLSLHADSTPLTGVAVDNKEVTLRVLDANGGLLHEFFGSLDTAAKDDYGQSLYLPDVAAKQTDLVELFVATGAAVPTTSDAYGRSLTGKAKWATSEVLVCFTESGTTYVESDYDRCISALRTAMTPFGYLMSGGSQAKTLLSKLGALGIETNIPTTIDVPGSLNPLAAVAWALDLNLDSHLIQFNWAPLTAEDPMNGGRAMWGAGGLKIGYSCARNARVNGKGFAPKNYPVSGKDWPLNRTSIRQESRPEDQELSDLAEAQINPVIFETYNGGGRYVFTDCLTAAKTRVSYKKLQSVAEMSVTLDNWVTTYSKELLMLPMREFIKRMDAFMDTLLEGAQASQWLVPSQNLDGNAAYAYTITPSSVRPADLVLVSYWCSYDGVARQVIVEQTLVK